MTIMKREKRSSKRGSSVAQKGGKLGVTKLQYRVVGVATDSIEFKRIQTRQAVQCMMSCQIDV